MRKHAAGTNVSRKSLRWDWRLEANLNRKANGLALEGLLWDFTYLCWNLTSDIRVVILAQRFSALQINFANRSMNLISVRFDPF